MKVIYTTMIIILSMLSARAQESLPVSGWDADGNGGSVSYSVGKMFYTTQSEGTGMVITGVQNAFEISEVTGVRQFLPLDLDISVYPNPTGHMVNLSIEEFKNKKLNYQLFDIQGKLLKKQQLSDRKTIIDMEDFVASNYFLKIMDQNSATKTFKIIKN